MKTVKTLFFLLMAFTLLLSACGPAAAPAAPAESAAPAQPAEPAAPTLDPNAPISGGTLIVGSPQEPGTLNPLLASASIEDAISSLSIEGLVQVNEKGEYQAVLAESLPTVSADGLVVTYTLIPGVKFSDGSDFTCADVKFTLDAILSDLSQASTSGYGDIESLECPDDYTVVGIFSKSRGQASE